MEKKIRTSGIVQTTLAVLMTIGMIVLLVFLLFKASQDQLRDVLLIVIGAFVSNWNSIINYFTGSTSTSEQKNALLAHSTPTPKEPVTVTTTSEDETTTTLKAPQQ